jgi:hypothetical protein
MTASMLVIRTVYGPVGASAFYTGSIRFNLVSLQTVPSNVSPSTGATLDRCGNYFRLELSTEPHYFSSLEKRLELAFDGNSQGNVVQGHTRCNTNCAGIDYGIVCLRPYPQDFEFIRHEAMMLMGSSELNQARRVVHEIAYAFFLHNFIEKWQKGAKVLEFGKLQVERETRAFLLDNLNGPSSGVERMQIISHLVRGKVR